MSKKIIKRLNDVPFTGTFRGGELGKISAQFLCYSPGNALIHEVDDCVRNWPQGMKLLLALSDIRFFVLNNPDDIGQESTKPDPNDFYKRSPAEIGCLYLNTRPSSIVILQDIFNREAWQYKLQANIPALVARAGMHALNDKTGLTNTKEFQEMYELDIARGNFNGQADYFLQKNAGPLRTFAHAGESFVTTKKPDPKMTAHWPHVTAWTGLVLYYLNEHIQHMKEEKIKEEIKRVVTEACAHAAKSVLSMRQPINPIKPAKSL